MLRGGDQTKVPEGLRELMKNLTKGILREKPANIYSFSADFFENLLKSQQRITDSKPLSDVHSFKFCECNSVPTALIYSLMPAPLTSLIKDFIKAVLKIHPQNILLFGLEYFRYLQKNNANKAPYINYEMVKPFTKGKEKVFLESSVKCACGRNFLCKRNNNYSDIKSGVEQKFESIQNISKNRSRYNQHNAEKTLSHNDSSNSLEKASDCYKEILISKNSETYGDQNRTFGERQLSNKGKNFLNKEISVEMRPQPINVESFKVISEPVDISLQNPIEKEQTNAEKEGSHSVSENSAIAEKSFSKSDMIDKNYGLHTSSPNYSETLKNMKLTKKNETPAELTTFNNSYQTNNSKDILHKNSEKENFTSAEESMGAVDIAVTKLHQPNQDIIDKSNTPHGIISLRSNDGDGETLKGIVNYEIENQNDVTTSEAEISSSCVTDPNEDFTHSQQQQSVQQKITSKENIQSSKALDPDIVLKSSSSEIDNLQKNPNSENFSLDKNTAVETTKHLETSKSFQDENDTFKKQLEEGELLTIENKDIKNSVDILPNEFKSLPDTEAINGDNIAPILIPKEPNSIELNSSNIPANKSNQYSNTVITSKTETPASSATDEKGDLIQLQEKPSMQQKIIDKENIKSIEILSPDITHKPSISKTSTLDRKMSSDDNFPKNSESEHFSLDKSTAVETSKHLQTSKSLQDENHTFHQQLQEGELLIKENKNIKKSVDILPKKCQSLPGTEAINGENFEPIFISKEPNNEESNSSHICSNKNNQDPNTVITSKTETPTSSANDEKGDLIQLQEKPSMQQKIIDEENIKIIEILSPDIIHRPSISKTSTLDRKMSSDDNFLKNSESENFSLDKSTAVETPKHLQTSKSLQDENHTFHQQLQEGELLIKENKNIKKSVDILPKKCQSLPSTEAINGENFGPIFISKEPHNKESNSSHICSNKNNQDPNTVITSKTETSTSSATDIKDDPIHPQDKPSMQEKIKDEENIKLIEILNPDITLKPPSSKPSTLDRKMSYDDKSPKNSVSEHFSLDKNTAVETTKHLESYKSFEDENHAVQEKFKEIDQSGIENKEISTSVEYLPDSSQSYTDIKNTDKNNSAVEFVPKNKNTEELNSSYMVSTESTQKDKEDNMIHPQEHQSMQQKIISKENNKPKTPSKTDTFDRNQSSEDNVPKNSDSEKYSLDRNTSVEMKNNLNTSKTFQDKNHTFQEKFKETDLVSFLSNSSQSVSDTKNIDKNTFASESTSKNPNSEELSSNYMGSTKSNQHPKAVIALGDKIPTSNASDEMDGMIHPQKHQSMQQEIINENIRSTEAVDPDVILNHSSLKTETLERNKSSDDNVSKNANSEELSVDRKHSVEMKNNLNIPKAFKDGNDAAQQNLKETDLSAIENEELSTSVVILPNSSKSDLDTQKIDKNNISAESPNSEELHSSYMGSTENNQDPNAVITSDTTKDAIIHSQEHQLMQQQNISKESIKSSNTNRNKSSVNNVPKNGDSEKFALNRNPSVEMKNSLNNSKTSQDENQTVRKKQKEAVLSAEKNKELSTSADIVPDSSQFDPDTKNTDKNYTAVDLVPKHKNTEELNSSYMVSTESTQDPNTITTPVAEIPTSNANYKKDNMIHPQEHQSMLQNIISKENIKSKSPAKSDTFDRNKSSDDNVSIDSGSEFSLHKNTSVETKNNLNTSKTFQDENHIVQEKLKEIDPSGIEKTELSTSVDILPNSSKSDPDTKKIDKNDFVDEFIPTNSNNEDISSSYMGSNKSGKDPNAVITSGDEILTSNATDKKDDIIYPQQHPYLQNKINSKENIKSKSPSKYDTLETNKTSDNNVPINSDSEFSLDKNTSVEMKNNLNTLKTFQDENHTVQEKLKETDPSAIEKTEPSTLVDMLSNSSKYDPDTKKIDKNDISADFIHKNPKNEDINSSYMGSIENNQDLNNILTSEAEVPTSCSTTTKDDTIQPQEHQSMQQKIISKENTKSKTPPKTDTFDRNSDSEFFLDKNTSVETKNNFNTSKTFQDENHTFQEKLKETDPSGIEKKELSTSVDILPNSSKSDPGTEKIDKNDFVDKFISTNSNNEGISSSAESGKDPNVVIISEAETTTSSVTDTKDDMNHPQEHQSMQQKIISKENIKSETLSKTDTLDRHKSSEDNVPKKSDGKKFSLDGNTSVEIENHLDTSRTCQGGNDTLQKELERTEFSATEKTEPSTSEPKSSKSVPDAEYIDKNIISADFIPKNSNKEKLNTCYMGSTESNQDPNAIITSGAEILPSSSNTIKNAKIHPQEQQSVQKKNITEENIKSSKTNTLDRNMSSDDNDPKSADSEKFSLNRKKTKNNSNVSKTFQDENDSIQEQLKATDSSGVEKKEPSTSVDILSNSSQSILDTKNIDKNGVSADFIPKTPSSEQLKTSYMGSTKSNQDPNTIITSDAEFATSSTTDKKNDIIYQQEHRSLQQEIITNENIKSIEDLDADVILKPWPSKTDTLCNNKSSDANFAKNSDSEKFSLDKNASAEIKNDLDTSRTFQDENHTVQQKQEETKLSVVGNKELSKALISAAEIPTSVAVNKNLKEVIHTQTIDQISGSADGNEAMFHQQPTMEIGNESENQNLTSEEFEGFPSEINSREVIEIVETNINPSEENAGRDITNEENNEMIPESAIEKMNSQVNEKKHIDESSNSRDDFGSKAKYGVEICENETNANYISLTKAFLESEKQFSNLITEVFEKPCIKKILSAGATKSETDSKESDDTDNVNDEKYSTPAKQTYQKHKESTVEIQPKQGSATPLFHTSDEEIIMLSDSTVSTPQISAEPSEDVVINFYDETTLDKENLTASFNLPTEKNEFDNEAKNSALKRFHTLPGDDSKTTLQSTSIDESSKTYMKMLENEDVDSFCLDEDATENIRKKMFASSISADDSDKSNPNWKNSQKSSCDTFCDDNIHTFLENTESSSSETTSTIILAATKIQAGARGFLARRKLHQTCVDTTKSSLQYNSNSKDSIGNNAISASLENLIENESARKIQKTFRNYRSKKPMKMVGGSSAPITNLQDSLAHKRLTLQRGDALRNNSFQENDDVGSIKTEEVGMSMPKKIHKTRDSCAHRTNRETANQYKWIGIRQNTMPVQIETNIFRIAPKHMPKKVSSAEGAKQRHKPA